MPKAAKPKPAAASGERRRREAPARVRRPATRRSRGEGSRPVVKRKRWAKLKASTAAPASKVAPAPESAASASAQCEQGAGSREQGAAKPGRPTKLTPEVQALIEAGVEGGLSPSRAAILAGVSPKTLSEWRQENAEFAEAIEQARSRGIQKRVADIDGAVTRFGTPDWKAKAWLLSKQAPDEFGDLVKHEHGGELKLVFPAEKLREIQERRRAARERILGKGQGDGR